MEETCWKLADRRASWLIFTEMESNGEISTLPISLHKINSTHKLLSSMIGLEGYNNEWECKLL
jgi:hypothetical protein